jgi:UDP-3-O-[3-hydroxymyristoyl] glucosamine N-acyltransferase
MRASELSRHIGGKLEGGDRDLIRVASLSDAGPEDLSFLSHDRYADQLAETGAGAVLVAEDYKGEAETEADVALIRVAAPYAALRQALEVLYPPREQPTGIHPTALIDPTAELGAGTAVGPYAVIEAEVKIGPNSAIGAGVFVGRAVQIGADCLLHPGVVVYSGSSLGDRVEMLANAVVGCDGFGHSQEDGRFLRIPQVGTAVIEDDVLIGSCSTVARATFGETRIKAGTKLDNLIMVAHNCSIGPNSAVAAQTGFAGSTKVGEGVQIGGQAGFAGHLTVNDGAIVGAQSGVTKDVPEGMYVFGYPARPSKEVWSQLAAMARLPELRRKVRELEQRLAELEAPED